MRVLLTGAAGFVGRAVAEELRAGGHEVVGVDALVSQAHPEGAQPPPGTHRRDLRHPDAVADLLAGIDVVCHQAAVVGAGTSPADLPAYAGHNDLGTAQLLAEMAAAGVGSLVMASSMVVYGDGAYSCDRDGPVRPAPRREEDLAAGRFDPVCPHCAGPVAWRRVAEDAVPDPRTHYAVSKLAQEHYARTWAHQTGGRVLALRYHNVYGPHMPRDTPYSGVAALFRSATEAGRPPRVFEDGAQMRDFVHVRDVARANALAVAAVVDAASGSATPLNVCSGVPVSILDVARLVSPGREPEVTGDYRAGDVRHVVAGPDRAREVLGFTAAVAPEEGLTRFRTDPLR